MTRSTGRTWVLVAAALVTIGSVSRIAPLFDHGDRLFQQFPTEDGYLMLTIARNLAAGHGMSTAEGTLPTNGTQPLATFLWAACFRLVDLDRRDGVLLVLGLEFLIACAAGLVLLRLGRRVLAGVPHGDALAALTASAWFASPMVVSHSMNGLETGLYGLAVLAVLTTLLPGRPEPARPALRRWAAVGVLLGLAFWARNDAVWLCLAVGVPHLAGVLPGWRGGRRDRVAELCVAASIALILSLPWPLHNWLAFGHIVPISGQAESLGADFAKNGGVVAIVLFEYLSLFLPIPSSFEATTAVRILCALLVLAALAGVGATASRWTEPARVLLVVGGLFALGLAGFYGLSFGAGYFMSRYLFPLSPLLALLSAAALGGLWQRLAPRLGAPLLAVPALVVLVLAAGLNVRLYLRGDAHQHEQVVEWVRQHVPSDVWVGAIQTGTLGFFHDRTINLDGKVNPEALAYRRQGGVAPYVVESEIQYLVDWVGIGSWAERPVIAAEFELVLEDRQRNLAVLRRRGAPRLEVPRSDARGLGA